MKGNAHVLKLLQRRAPARPGPAEREAGEGAPAADPAGERAEPQVVRDGQEPKEALRRRRQAQGGGASSNPVFSISLDNVYILFLAHQKDSSNGKFENACAHQTKSGTRDWRKLYMDSICGCRDKMVSRVYKGIPDSMRGAAWKLLLDIDRKKEEQRGRYRVRTLHCLIYYSLASDGQITSLIRFESTEPG